MSALPITIVLDTNFLTIPAEFGVDIFSEIERIIERRAHLVILEPVLSEIKHRLANPRGHRERQKFKMALDLVERCELVPMSESDSPVDDLLIQYCLANHAVLATCDKELKRKAKQAHIPVIFLRGKKRLTLDGSLI